MGPYRVKDLVDFNPRTPLPREGDVPFIEMAALPTSGRDIIEIGRRSVGSGGARFQNGDTLLARITPCLENGKGAQVAGLDGQGVGQGSTEFIVMRAKDRRDRDFVYYLSRHPDFRTHAIQQMSGTSGRQRVAWQSISEFEICSLDVDTRHAIGSILSALDDKIELNRRMNETLEASARALFRDWFVDFGPTRAKAEGRPAYLAPEIWSLFPERLDEDDIPDGWRRGTLAEIIDVSPAEPIKRGVAAPYLDMSALPTSGPNAKPAVEREYTSGTRFRNGDTLLARITPCLENGKTAFVQALPENTVGWGSTEFIVLRAIWPVPESVPYLIARDDGFRRHAIQSMTGTSGRQRASADAVAGYPIALPLEDHLWRRLSPALDSTFDRIARNARVSQALAATRDALLPKLMSGEIRVRDAEALAA